MGFNWGFKGLKFDATPGADDSYPNREAVFLSKCAQSHVSTDNDSVMSDDGESDE